MSTVSAFISYAHEDRAFVDDLTRRLEAAGIPTSYDRHLTPVAPGRKSWRTAFAHPRSLSWS
ncbi:MAG: toll/interleukin-1 receptor domain-containing protein [Armatimonadetes bacterium]|nr:toll/interleukin-1 receptor domain-containing protein [Armatimonadota bacterium]